MGRGKQRVDIHQEIKNILRSKERFGHSRHDDKLVGIAKNGIYAYETARVYNRECQKFAEYVKEHSPQGRYTPLEAAKEYARGYIQERNENKEISPYTVKMQRAALAKLFNCDARDFGIVEARKRENIKRSRERTVISPITGKEIKNQRTNAGHFSERKNSEIVNFAKGTGLRRSELESLKGNQLVEHGDNYYLRVIGKGGKERFALIRGSNVSDIVERCRIAGNGPVWDKVPAHMDVHHYRSVYASEMYQELARERNNIPREDRYCCRGDLAGTWYDRKAMMEVSLSLGHNRIGVIAEHYLR